jgi:membrane glycosyltransferase
VGTSWSDAWHFHKRDTLLAAIAATVFWFLSPALLAWVSPALLGLLLAVPLSRASGSVWLGEALAKVALLRTPEEIEVPSLVARRAELIATSRSLPDDGLAFLARNRDARLAHVDDNLPRPVDPPGRPNPDAFTAQQKLIDARSLEEALGWLTRVERVEIAGSARLLNQLAQLPDAQPSTLLI